MFGLLAVWLTLSVSLVMLNKFVMSATPCRFPLTLALLHMSSGFLFAKACLFAKPAAKTVSNVLREQNMSHRCQFWAVGALLAAVLLTSNAAFARLNVAMIQMLKASTPVTIFALGVLSRTEEYAHIKAANVLVIGVGVMIAAYGQISFDATGIALQLTSIVLDSMRCLLLQKVISGFGTTLDPLTTLVQVAPAAVVTLLIPSAAFEWSKLAASTCMPSSWPYLLISCFVAFSLNLVVCALIGATSALTTSVSGILKDFVSLYLVLECDHFFRSPVLLNSPGPSLFISYCSTQTCQQTQVCIGIDVAFHSVHVGALQWAGYAVAIAALTVYHARRHLGFLGKIDELSQGAHNQKPR